MLFHGSASVSPQEGEEHHAAPLGGKPKCEAYCSDTLSSGIEIYGIITGRCRRGKHGCRLPEDGTRGLQIKPLLSEDGSLRGRQ